LPYAFNYGLSRELLKTHLAGAAAIAAEPLLTLHPRTAGPAYGDTRTAASFPDRSEIRGGMGCLPLIGAPGAVLPHFRFAVAPLPPNFSA
jgi:hypothetical protein